MYRPTQILDSLIYLHTILSSFCGSESVMLYLQSPQYPHSRLRKRIPLDSWYLQIGDHLVKVIVKERTHLLEHSRCFWFYLDLFQILQGFPRFFLVPAIAKQMPHTQEETPHSIHLLVFFIIYPENSYVKSQGENGVVYSIEGFSDLTHSPSSVPNNLLINTIEPYSYQQTDHTAVCCEVAANL